TRTGVLQSTPLRLWRAAVLWFRRAHLGYTPLLLCLPRALRWLMKKDQIEEGRISDHSKGLGTVTQEMVRARAREIALINGRSPEHLSPADYSQAKRELTGQHDVEPPEEQLPT